MNRRDLLKTGLKAAALTPLVALPVAALASEPELVPMGTTLIPTKVTILGHEVQPDANGIYRVTMAPTVDDLNKYLHAAAVQLKSQMGRVLDSRAANDWSMKASDKQANYLSNHERLQSNESEKPIHILWHETESEHFFAGGIWGQLHPVDAANQLVERWAEHRFYPKWEDALDYGMSNFRLTLLSQIRFFPSQCDEFMLNQPGFKMNDADIYPRVVAKYEDKECILYAGATQYSPGADWDIRLTADVGDEVFNFRERLRKTQFALQKDHAQITALNGAASGDINISIGDCTTGEIHQKPFRKLAKAMRRELRKKTV